MNEWKTRTLPGMTVYGRAKPWLDFAGNARNPGETAIPNYNQVGIDLWNQQNPATGMSAYQPTTQGTGSGLGFSTGGGGGKPWYKSPGFWGKLAGGAAMAGGVVSSTEAFENLNIDFKPTLTAKKAEDLITTKGASLARGIRRGAAQGMGDVGSQYAARGLGSSGAVIGDVAGLGQMAEGQVADIQADLNQQLMSILQYIDQRDFQQAAMESQSKSGFMGDLADLLLTGGGMLLAGPTGGASVPISQAARTLI